MTIDILVGRVGRAHGIRGDLTIDVRTDEPDRRFAPGAVFNTRRGTLTIASMRWHSGRLLVRFEEVPDRTAAEGLRGTELRVDIDPHQRPDDPEEFYDHQLVGLQVETEQGDVRGEVTDVLHLPAQDLLVVRRSDPDAADPESLVPFVAEFVPNVDLAAGRIVVTDTAGLFEQDTQDSEEQEIETR